MASIAILAAIFLWSSLGVVVRLSGVEIHVLMFYSLVVASLVQGVILCGRRYRGAVLRRENVQFPVVLGIVSCVNTFTYFFAFTRTTIANAVLTHYTAPVIVAFLAPFFLRERLTAKILFVIALATAGLWIMLDGFSIAEEQMMGIVAGLVSGVAYAIIIILLKMHAQRYHPLLLAFFANLTVMLILAPFVRSFPAHAAWSYLVIGIIHSTIAPLLYFWGFKGVTANRAAILGYIEPVCAIVFGMMFLQEKPGIHSLIGGVLILVSGYLTLRRSGTE